MKKPVISTATAPGAIGPYSQAVKAGGFLFLSGQVSLDPATGTLVQGGVAEETRQCLRNLGEVLKAAGLGFEDVVRTTVFLADMADFERMNRVYAEVFGEHRPARSTVQVAGLPREARVEIDAIAELRQV
jgi:2-iminobutanoate/2-iminopropanoate deaminase